MGTVSFVEPIDELIKLKCRPIALEHACRRKFVELENEPSGFRHAHDRPVVVAARCTSAPSLKIEGRLGDEPAVTRLASPAPGC